MKGVSRWPDQVRSNRGLVMRLYIAGKAPNSRQALSNLQEICQDNLKSLQYELEVIDILEDPERAVSDGVVITPTLVRLWPLPQIKIIGNLKQRVKVMQLLGIEEVSQ